MKAWLDDDDYVGRGFPTNPDTRYFATLEALDEAVTTLQARLASARTAQLPNRTGVLDELHARVRGMSLLLNDALGDVKGEQKAYPRT